MSYKLIFGPLEKLILGGIIALKVAIYRRLGMRRIVYKRNIKKRATFPVFALCPAQTIVLDVMWFRAWKATGADHTDRSHR